MSYKEKENSENPKKSRTGMLKTGKSKQGKKETNFKIIINDTKMNLKSIKESTGNYEIYNKETKVCFVIFLICLLISFNKSYGQTCLTNGITFSTQGSIDSFSINYPGCSNILGEVNIIGNSITSLNGLSQVNKIGGGFNIGIRIENTNLINLNGLGNITDINNRIIIKNNPNLQNLTGLNSLDTLIGGLEILDNNLLNSLIGLNNVKFCGSHIQISENHSLISFQGLNNLESIGYYEPTNYCNTTAYFRINNNFNLTSTMGLENLHTVCGYLSFQNNLALANLNLNSLEYINGFFELYQNSQLTNLNSLENLYYSQSLTFRYNGNLTNISALQNLTGHTDFDVTLEANKLSNFNGLNNVTQIHNFNIENEDYITSMDGLTSISKILSSLNIGYCNQLQNINQLSAIDSIGAGLSTNGGLWLNNNPLLNNFNGLNNIVKIAGILYLRSCKFTNFNWIQSLERINGPFVVEQNNLLTTFLGLNNLNYIGNTTEIKNNPNLGSFTGLEQLENINGSLYIIDNPALNNIISLSNLNQINGILEIRSNVNLPSLAGLHNVNFNNITNLKLEGNFNLSICDVQNVCDYLSAIPIKPATISSNAINCNSRLEIEAECTSALPVIMRSFDVINYRNYPKLIWSVEIQINNKGWEIERSNDGYNFESIDFMEGESYSTEKKDYTFLDQNALSNINYYRLKQIDLDGNVNYSEVEEIILNNNSENLTLFPNPAIDVLNARNNFLNKEYRISNSIGRICDNGIINQNDEIDISRLQIGVYYLTILGSGDKVKFIKTK